MTEITPRFKTNNAITYHVQYNDALTRHVIVFTCAVPELTGVYALIDDAWDPLTGELTWGAEELLTLNFSLAVLEKQASEKATTTKEG